MYYQTKRTQKQREHSCWKNDGRNSRYNNTLALFTVYNLEFWMSSIATIRLSKNKRLRKRFKSRNVPIIVETLDLSFGFANFQNSNHNNILSSLLELLLKYHWMYFLSSLAEGIIKNSSKTNCISFAKSWKVLHRWFLFLFGR